MPTEGEVDIDPEGVTLEMSDKAVDLTESARASRRLTGLNERLRRGNEKLGTMVIHKGKPEKVHTLCSQPGVKGIVWTFKDMVTAEWLSLGEKYDRADMKQQVYDENVQMSLLSALLLTIVFPLSYEFNDDWLPTGHAGYIASTWLDNQLDEPFWHDVSLCGYIGGVMGMLFSMLTSIFTMLASGELNEDYMLKFYDQYLGIGRKLPYFFFQIGVVFFLVVGTVPRWILCFQTLGALVIFAIFVGLCIVIFLVLGLIGVVQGAHMTVFVEQSYPEVGMSEETVLQLGKKYFDVMGDHINLDDFVRSIQPVAEVAGCDYSVPLTFKSRVLCRKIFWMLLGADLGMKMDEATLSRIVLGADYRQNKA